MKFEWDEKKSAINLSKHGIDFNAAKALWEDEDRIQIQTPFPIENRSILIGKIGAKLWAAVYTHRNNAIRIISVRRARKKEAGIYEQKEIS